MSFGVVQAMISSIKNNKRTRKSALKNLKDNGDYSTKTELHFENKATKHQLQNIREKLEEENKKAFRKKAIIIAVVLAAAIYFIGFAKF